MESFVWGECGDICWGVGGGEEKVGQGMGGVGKVKRDVGSVKKCVKCGCTFIFFFSVFFSFLIV